jgi:hypothetical protein
MVLFRDLRRNLPCVALRLLVVRPRNRACSGREGYRPGKKETMKIKTKRYLLELQQARKATLNRFRVQMDV